MHSVFLTQQQYAVLFNHFKSFTDNLVDGDHLVVQIAINEGKANVVRTYYDFVSKIMALTDLLSEAGCPVDLDEVLETKLYMGDSFKRGVVIQELFFVRLPEVGDTYQALDEDFIVASAPYKENGEWFAEVNVKDGGEARFLLNLDGKLVRQS